MIRSFLSLGVVKRHLIEGTLPNTQAFLYFLVITGVDNLQLAVLQVSPARPTVWTPVAVWGSLLAGAVFLVGTYLLNGGSAVRDYLVRYFALTGLVAVWIALPFQLLISLPRALEGLSRIEWYVPMVLLITNLGLFSFITLQVRDVAVRSQGELARGDA